MKVLVACEFSGIVRDAFAALGHDAWSCDIVPSEVGGQHIRDDVLAHLQEGWDLMIAHPPCTHLSVSGAAWFKEKRADGRQQKAIEFFLALANAALPRSAIENPVCIMNTLYRKPDQIIQPYYFGHPESKTTCLWLRGLAPLRPTKYVPPSWYNEKGLPRYNNQTPAGQDKRGPSPTRGADRARTYPGIALAMAEQWGAASDYPAQMALL